MGSRPSTFKSGGGYLTGECRWESYQFLTGKQTIASKGPNKGKPFTPLSLEVALHMEGADEATTKRLLIGDAAAFGAVSKDGLTLNTPEGQAITKTTEAGVFIGSMCSPEVGEGFPEDRLDADDTIVNYEPMLRTRMRIANAVDAEKTTRLGKEKGKDKDGNAKEYDRRTLRVTEILELPSVKGSKAGAVRTVTRAANGKPNGAAVEVNVDQVLDEALVKMVAKFGTSFEKSKIASAQGQILLKKAYPGQDEVIRKALVSDDYLVAAVERGVIENYDNGVITAAA